MREKMIERVNLLRKSVREGDPRQFALRTGAELVKAGAGVSVLRVRLYGEAHLIEFPEMVVRVEATGKECGLNRTGMFLYYLQTADGTPPADKWIAFRELPGGMFYHQAYQGYSGDRLAKAIDNRSSVFERAAQNLGGVRLALGDSSFAFQALPRVRVAAVYYAGDEDFPATANILFDGASSHYLPTDALAGLGSMLVDRLTVTESRDDEE
jgi:hypothetical protein